MRKELEAVVFEVEKAIVGKRGVIEKVLTAMLADGHILLDDIPGMGKTTLAAALARAIGLDSRRIQFTPDVLPSDIVGFSIYDKESGSFVYRPGVLNHANLVLCDEINRASARTQSALLEAMEERQVTVDGNTYPMEKPFLLIATQNNVGAGGTQVLPYAQVDRFLVRLSIGYPSHEEQVTMLRDRRKADPINTIQTVLSKESFLQMQQAVHDVTVMDNVLDYISRLCIASREHNMVEVGISPRGALYLERMAMAKAWLDGRDYVTGADVRDIFLDVCAHRILLNRGALSGKMTAEQVLNDVLQSVENPDHRVVR